jgi:hypothetical protein
MQKGNHKQALYCLYYICNSTGFSIDFVYYAYQHYTLLNNAAFAQSSFLSSSPVAGINNNIPSAKSVFDTGTISLPSSAKGFVISLPDETHKLDTSNKTISQQNAHYLPTDLVIPSGTAIAFVHGDPNLLKPTCRVYLSSR